MWLPPKTSGCTSKLTVNGVSNRPAVTPPIRIGMMIEMARRIWARPIVATVRMSRGAVWNRRITVLSMSAPSRAATTKPIKMAAK